LRNVQTFCRVGKMQFLRDSDETFEFPKRWAIRAIKVSIIVAKLLREVSVRPMLV